MTRTRKLLAAQSLVLLGGAMFAWSKLVPQITHFQATYGTLLRFSDITIPNPLLTACLYGSTAFLVALVWSLSVFQKPSLASERWLRNFLLFGVIFAGSVVFSEFAAYYKWFTTAVSVTCSPGVAPLETPCFYGLVFFSLAFVVSIFAIRHLKRVADLSEGGEGETPGARQAGTIEG